LEALLAALEMSSWAQHLRASRWGYAAVSTGHVLGIALLVGAVVPLDLRLLGVWRRPAVAELARILVPAAMTGLVLAMATGFLLFSIRAQEYAAVGVLQAKLALILLGTLSALAAHLRYGAGLERAGARELALHGAVSLGCWICALVCGRLIAFAGE
jgi:hypothetical protein